MISEGVGTTASEDAFTNRTPPGSAWKRTESFSKARARTRVHWFVVTPAQKVQHQGLLLVESALNRLERSSTTYRVCCSTYQLRCRVLCKPHGGKTVRATGQQSDDDVHKRDPIGEVGPERNDRKQRGVKHRLLSTGRRPLASRPPSPVAVEVVQLLLHVAAQAASVVSIQPLPHHTHAVLPLVLVKRKVLDLRGDATTETRMGLARRCSGSLG